MSLGIQDFTFLIIGIILLVTDRFVKSSGEQNRWSRTSKVVGITAIVIGLAIILLKLK